MHGIASLTALALLMEASAASAVPPPSFAVNLAVYRSSTSTYYSLKDLATRSLGIGGVFGQAGDRPVVGDFDGNGVLDLAIFRAGVWFVDTSHDLVTDSTPNFGGGGDMPLAADFDGDGLADLVVFRNGTWFIRSSKTGTVSTRSLGAAGDSPVIADFDGDGVPDIATYRLGNWSIQTQGTSGANVMAHFGGVPGDQPCAVDWDHDGRAELCVYRDGIWYFRAVDGTALMDTYAFGGKGDIPLSGGSFDLPGAVYVKAGASGTQDGTAAHPFATVVQAFGAVPAGGVIRMAPGSYTENNFFLWGPLHQYAPGKFGKNNVKLLGVDRRAVSWVPTSGDAIQFYGSTGSVIEGIAFGSATGRGLTLVGGAGSVSASDPGATLSLLLVDVIDTSSYGMLITGSSKATIRRSRLNSSKTQSGIGLQSGTPAVDVRDSEMAYNAYTLASGANGSGIEAQSSATVVAAGNHIHHNNRFGVIAVTDTDLTLTGNLIELNQLNGVIVCGASSNDSSSATITGNTISDNGLNHSNGQGYNGVELFITCTGVHTVSQNTLRNNSLNGIFVGSGTLNASQNVFDNNQDGITIYTDNSASANTVVSVFGNVFRGNRADGVFIDREGTAHTITATIGGTQAGRPNQISGSGLHGIGCNSNLAGVTCPAGGNSFSGNVVDDIESLCPSTCQH